MRRFVMGMAWIGAATGGCVGGERTIDEREDAWVARMTELDAHAVAARDAVVRGDLDRARAAGAKLRAALPDEEVPAALTSALDALDAAKTTEDGAEAIAELAVGCLSCHAARHVTLAGRPPASPSPVTGAVPAEMERHRVFVDSVWLGLIGGDDAPLRDAARRMAQGGLVAGTPVGRDPAFTLTAAIAAIDERAHRISEDLVAAPRDRRSDLFADLLGTCAACHDLAADRAVLTRPSPVPPNPSMNDHYVDLLRLELAVIGGDVDAARAAAGSLAQAQIDAPPEAEIHVTALRADAAKVALSNELPALAQGAASLMATCGQCHRATTRGPRAPVEPPPSPEASEMARHLYASFWLGQGLVADDEVAWMAGAESLAATGLGPLGKDPAADAAVHALAGRAQRAATPAERAQVYGEVLATCHGCHEQLPR